MSSTIKMGIVIGVTALGAGLGWHFGATKRERLLGVAAGGMFGYGASSMATRMVPEAPIGPPSPPSANV